MQNTENTLEFPASTTQFPGVAKVAKPSPRKKKKKKSDRSYSGGGSRGSSRSGSARRLRHQYGGTLEATQSGLLDNQADVIRWARLGATLGYGIGNMDDAIAPDWYEVAIDAYNKRLMQIGGRSANIA
jgi:hypothetical protein